MSYGVLLTEYQVVQLAENEPNFKIHNQIEMIRLLYNRVFSQSKVRLKRRAHFNCIVGVEPSRSEIGALNYQVNYTILRSHKCSINVW